MNVFENIRDKVLSLFNPNSWVKWIHEGTMPAYTRKDREANIDYASKSNHCAKCLNLSHTVVEPARRDALNAYPLWGLRSQSGEQCYACDRVVGGVMRCNTSSRRAYSTGSNSFARLSSAYKVRLLYG